MIEKLRRGAGVLLALLMAAGVLRAYAQETAQEILDQVKKKYDTIRDAEISFTQSVKFPLANVEQKASGTLMMKKGNHYRIQLEGQTIVTDGTTVWSYSKANNQVLVDRFRADERTLSPERILGGAPEDYNAVLVGKEKLGKTSTYVLKLTPADEQSSLQSLKLWVSDQDWMIRHAEILDVNGKETTYVVHQVKTNIGVPDKDFTFEPPAGAEVVDLR